MWDQLIKIPSAFAGGGGGLPGISSGGAMSSTTSVGPATYEGGGGTIAFGDKQVIGANTALLLGGGLFVFLVLGLMKMKRKK